MAEAMRCVRCGASLREAVLRVASLPCSSCGHVNRMDGATLEALGQHERAVGEEGQTARQAGQAATHAELGRSFGGGWAVAFVVSWILSGLVLLPGTPLAYALSGLIFLGPFVALWFVAKRRRQELEGAQVRAEAGARARRVVAVSCPGCGGQNELAPEAPVQPCVYCDGALAADEGARAALLELARTHAQSEERRAREQGWLLAAARHVDPPTELVPLFVFAMIAVPFVLATLAVLVRRVVAVEPGGPAGIELALLCAVSLVMLVILVAPLWIRRRRAQRWTAALERLSARSGGALDRELRTFAEHLGAHWRGHFSSAQICAGRGYACIRCAGAPWWVMSIAPLAQDEGAVEAHLRVLIPGDPEGARLRAWATRLEARGFVCRADLEGGGVVASWDAARVSSLYRDPRVLDAVAEAFEG